MSDIVPTSAPTSADRFSTLLSALPAGIVCEETQWMGGQYKYTLRCEQGHVWRRRPSDVRADPHCSQCVRGPQARLERLKKTLAALGIRCLDSEWQGARGAHRLACACGHEWVRYGYDINKPTGCPICERKKVGLPKLVHENLARLQAVAIQKGGVCLSSDYTGLVGRYRFRCAHGHEWSTRAARILWENTWCSACVAIDRGKQRQRQDGLEHLHEHARQKGGVCLSTEYLGQNHFYRFRCGKGHEWESKASNIFGQGTWCKRCVADSLRRNIDDMRALAESRGGRCLSEVYEHNKAKLTWECDRGHRWLACYASVRKGTWCRECAILAVTKKPHLRAKRLAVALPEEALMLGAAGRKALGARRR